jgi:hypothetical protein
MKLTPQQFSENYAQLPREEQLPAWRKVQYNPNYSPEERVQLWEALRDNPKVKVTPFHPAQHETNKYNQLRPFSEAEASRYWTTVRRLHNNSEN